MSNQPKPLASTTKKLLVAAGVLVTGAALFLSQNTTTVQASDAGKFVTAKDVSAGSNFATLLTKDGDVYSRGWNSQGQLGIESGQKVNVSDWEKVPLKEKISSIDSPYDHTVALSTSGHIFTWGPNDVGQSGNGSTNPTYTPNQVTAAVRFQQITAGNDFTLALDKDGQLWSWGDNSKGQLGDGTTKPHTTPDVAKTDEKFASIYAGKDFAIARTNTGGLYAWGDNSKGQLGDGTTNSRNTPAATAGGQTWSSVATNIQSQSVLAISSAGYLYSWGSNAHGELGVGVDWRAQQAAENQRVKDEIARIKAQDDARRQSLIAQCVNDAVAKAEQKAQEDAQKEFEQQQKEQKAQQKASPSPTPTPSETPSPSGTAAPSNTPSPSPSDTPTPTPSASPTPKPVNPQDYVADCTAQVDATFKHTDTSNIKPRTITEPALRADSNDPIQVTAAVQFSKAALGSQNGYAVDVLNRLYSWGSDASGQTGINVDDAKAHTQVPVQILTQVNSVAAGDKFGVATTTAGGVYVWGANAHGETLADPNNEKQVLTPTERGNGYNNVIAGPNTVYAFTGNTVRAWGDNSKGQLGANNNSAQVFTPAELTTRLQSLAPFNTGVVGLDLSNQLVSWGQNREGEFGTGTTSKDSVRSVTAKVIDTFKTAKAGYLYSLAVDNTGQVWGWGYGDSGLLGANNPGNNLYPVAVPVASNVTNIAAGKLVAIASTDKKVVIWGSGLNGQTQQYDLSNIKQIAAGDKHVLALTKDGDLWNWGDETTGVKNQKEQRTLVEADTAHTYSYVAAGAGTTFGITTEGKLIGWGNNENNILQFSDDKETTNVNLDLKTIHLAGTYAAGVDKNGVAWAWGSNSYGVFGLPSESKVPTALPLTTSEGN
jgi:alpha-tubulin suppressor-like RCC1 family protein